MTEFVWREERTDHAIRDALDRRHPERLQLRPNDVRGVREGFDLVDQMWAPTIERASRLPRPLLHERVNGEYSFVETLHHLLFAWDSWLTRMLLRVPNAYHELGVAPEARPEDVVDLATAAGDTFLTGSPTRPPTALG